MTYIHTQGREYPSSVWPPVYGESTAPNTDNDSAVPDVEDCSSDHVPHKGKRTIIVPDFNSMFKHLFNRELANKRLEVYSYLNRLLRRGQLSQIVGFPVYNRVIDREACEIKGVSFWKISRSEFFADVEVELTLRTRGNTIQWNGILVCWCGFADQFYMTVEDLTDVNYHRDANMTPLSPFLVPYYKNKRMDEIAERLWEEYGMPEALVDPKARDAVRLAERMGLSILYLPVYEHKDMDSIVFFQDSTLLVGEDRIEKDESGRRIIIKDACGVTQMIPANTIVINTNRVQKEYAAFAIFHECIHYEEHYLAYRLQALGSNDIRIVKTKKIEVEDGKEYRDPIYFMEKQANRGAYGLMAPATDTRRRIAELCGKVTNARNFGEKFESVGLSLAARLRLPHFRVRARMIQLGYIEAKGALNYVDRQRIPAFAFHIDAWREEEHTFVVTPGNVHMLCENNDDFKRIMNSGQYVYADGHVVRNEPRFVTTDCGISRMTELALSCVDDCCLRFVRLYIQKNVGTYVLGRMFMDTEYVKQTLFYLDDYINQQHLDEFDAKRKYIAEFPVEFKDAVDLLKKYNKTSYAKIAEFLYMTDDMFGRSLTDPKKYKNEDFLTALCLYFKLPDWLSRMLFKRAHVSLDEDDKRHAVLLHILRAQSCDDLEAANDYLKQHGLAPLSW